MSDQLNELNQLLEQNDDVVELPQAAFQSSRIEPPTQRMELPQESLKPQEGPRKIEAEQLLNDFQDASREILNNFRDDRRQVDEVAQHLWDRVKNDPDAPRVYVEQLVSALGVKADINANACKLLEAKAKMMSAGKPAFINNNNALFSGSDLDDLLSKPVQ